MSNDEPLAIKKQKQSGDAAANMDLNIQASVNNKVMQDNQKELPQLTRSLTWLNGNNARSCGQCGCEISVARLMAVLDSRLCLSCAATNNS
jgi:RNA polymerase-binding transcription factor DksA